MLSTSLMIREAHAQDAEAITALLSELNQEEGYDHSASLAAVQELMVSTKLHARAIVALTGNTIIGAALFYWGYDTVSASYGYHLADIIVTKTQRSQTIGSRLFHALALQCLKEQGQWISLTVLKKNTRATRFYQRMGMVEVAVNFYAIGPKGLKVCAQRGGN